MNKTIICIFALLLTSIYVSAQDIIILRNGTEINGKAELVSNGQLTYILDGQKNQLPTNELYLIKYKSRGNVFYTKEGESKFNSENNGNKLSKKSIAIYLTEGSEIVATEVNVTSDEIKYKVAQKGGLSALTGLFGKTKSSDWISLDKSKVFLIRYPDGSKEVINDMAKADEQARLDALPKVKHPFIPVNKDSSYPYPGEITMADGTTISVIIYDQDREYVHYRAKEWQDGPIFRMKKSKIKNISTIK